MNKFAPHFQRFSAEMRDLIVKWQPPFVVWVDPSQEGVEEIRRISPGTFIIGRKHEEGGWNSPNLKDRACYWADECTRMGHCDAYYVWNEPISHDDKANFGRLDDFHMHFRERVLAHGMEAVGLNMATGNFTALDDIAECFPQTCATFAHLGIHEYDWIIDPAKRPVDLDRLGFYWGRWPYWLENIGNGNLTLWITECGMTQAVHEGRPDEGWRSGADGMTDDDYIAWAAWYNRQIVKDKRVGGAALFNFAGWGWETFEHLGWERLGEILALDAPEPDGGNDVDIKIYDRDGNRRDWVWLEENYGLLEVHPVTEIYQPGEGEIVYRVAYFREKTGDTSCIINVRDLDGNPVQGETVMWGWPDVEEHGYERKPWDWTDGHGRPGDTNENGDVGPGMGKDSYYKPPDIGPHWCWVWDKPSEFVKGLGMIAGTNHDHLDVGYCAVKWEENGDGDGDGPEPGDIAELLYDVKEAVEQNIKLAEMGKDWWRFEFYE